MAAAERLGIPSVIQLHLDHAQLFLSKSRPYPILAWPAAFDHFTPTCAGGPGIVVAGHMYAPCPVPVLLVRRPNGATDHECSNAACGFRILGIHRPVSREGDRRYWRDRAHPEFPDGLNPEVLLPLTTNDERRRYQWRIEPAVVFADALPRHIQDGCLWIAALPRVDNRSDRNFDHLLATHS
jgi:hypothetical protein